MTDVHVETYTYSKLRSKNGYFTVVSLAYVTSTKHSHLVIKQSRKLAWNHCSGVGPTRLRNKENCCITSAFQSSSVAVRSKDLNSRAAPLSNRERRCSGVRRGDARRPQSSDVKSEKSRARELTLDRRSNSDGEMRGPEERCCGFKQI